MFNCSLIAKRRLHAASLALAAFGLVVLAGGCTRRPAEDETKKDEWAWPDKSDRPATANGQEAETPRRVDPEPEPQRTTNRLSSPHRQDPEPPPEPIRREPEVVTAAAGTALRATLDSGIDSGTAAIGQAVQATLTSAVTDAGGRTVLPSGTRLNGTVTEVQSARKVKKKSILAFNFTRAVLPDGTTVPIGAGQRFEGEGYTGKDGAVIGGSAAGGAILGQILGKDTESTAKGAVLGGAIGTGIVMAKRGEDISLPAGTNLDLRLDTDVRVES